MLGCGRESPTRALPICPMPTAHHRGVHQGDHGCSNFSDKDEEEDEEELRREQGAAFAGETEGPLCPTSPHPSPW